MVQILEGGEHWESLGYKVVTGDFSEGSRIVLERPAETSLTVVSENTDIDDIVQAAAFANVTDEVKHVVSSILLF